MSLSKPEESFVFLLYSDLSTIFLKKDYILLATVLFPTVAHQQFAYHFLKKLLVSQVNKNSELGIS